MRLIFAALLLAFGVFFTSIELSAQSSSSTHSSQGSRRSDQREYSSGEEYSISNESEQSVNSANSRTGRRRFQRLRLTQSEDLRDSASSSLRQQNENRASSGHQRSLSRSHGASSSHREEGYQRHFKQQGNFEQQKLRDSASSSLRQQNSNHALSGNQRSPSRSIEQQGHSIFDYSDSLSLSSGSFGSHQSHHLSPRGPLSLQYSSSSSESGSNHGSPSHHLP